VQPNNNNKDEGDQKGQRFETFLTMDQVQSYSSQEDPNNMLEETKDYQKIFNQRVQLHSAAEMKHKPKSIDKLAKSTKFSLKK
jgi:hypothetical protein